MDQAIYHSNLDFIADTDDLIVTNEADWLLYDDPSNF